MKAKKYYPAQYIREWIYRGYIENSDEDYVQPASLDITLKLDKSIIVKKNQTVKIPINEKVFKLVSNIPNLLVKYASRSTTARNGVKVHYSYTNNHLIITPLLYDIVLNNNMRLGQLYFIDNKKSTKVDRTFLSLDNNMYADSDGILIPTHIKELLPNTFYLGKSLETVTIPNNKIGFLLDNHITFGMYFTHVNAGLFDPGFTGKAVYEIYSATPHIIPNTAHFAKLVYMDLVEETDTPYKSTYNNQGLNDLDSILPKTNYKHNPKEE
jgi:deoxycytidine triphosphate deaminase